MDWRASKYPGIRGTWSKKVEISIDRSIEDRSWTRPQWTLVTMVQNERTKGIIVSSPFIYIFFSTFLLFLSSSTYRHDTFRITYIRGLPRTYKMEFNAFLEFITWAGRDSYFETVGKKYIFQAWRYFCFNPHLSLALCPLCYRACRFEF